MKEQSIPDSDEQRSNSTIRFIPSESCGISLQQWCRQAEVSRTPCLICRYAFSDVRRHTFYRCASPRHQRGLNLAHDPRLFFAGAPSHLHNDFVACVMRQGNREAKRSGCRSVSWVPAGVGAITKVEEIRFPDGRVYKLKLPWYWTQNIALVPSLSPRNLLSDFISTNERCFKPGLHKTDMHSSWNDWLGLWMWPWVRRHS